MKKLSILATCVLLTACQTNQAGKPTPEKKRVSSVKKNSPKPSGKCRVSGLNWKHADQRLKVGLCKLSRTYGLVQITPSGSCRTKRGNRGARRSYHLYNRGCKAADLRIKGVAGATILQWWAKNIGGGRGYYRCRSFVHVDTGPNRTWFWNLCKRRKRRA